MFRIQKTCDNGKDSNCQEVIRLENVGKRFKLIHQKERHIENLFSNVPRGFGTEEYWALRNIDMKVKKARIVGIIGRNGAGKTTLLNILANIFSPTEGAVTTKGKVSSLLSLGAGFKRELSGRENIFLNGLILGMSNSEIKSKFNDIVDFSELNDFIDTPVQGYSQGMLLRLGFSIAVHVDFEILLIDEVISVGDLAFQKRCYEKIVDFKRQGKTMIISSHTLSYIERICDEAYLLENGKIVSQGEPEEVTSYYARLSNEKRFSKNR